MGNIKWTTPEEERFLENNVEQYHAAQEGKRVSQWLMSFFLRWFTKFAMYSDGRNMTDHNVVKKVSTATVTVLQVFGH